VTITNVTICHTLNVTCTNPVSVFVWNPDQNDSELFVETRTYCSVFMKMLTMMATSTRTTTLVASNAHSTTPLTMGVVKKNLPLPPCLCPEENCDPPSLVFSHISLTNAFSEYNVAHTAHVGTVLGMSASPGRPIFSTPSRALLKLGTRFSHVAICSIPSCVRPRKTF